MPANAGLNTFERTRHLRAVRVLAVMFFAACVLDHDQRLRLMAKYVEKAAKRLFGIPEFKYDALSDGLQALFSRHPANQSGRQGHQETHSSNSR